MKKRIICSILVVVMLALSLTGCGYSLAKDDLNQYASLDANKLSDFLKNVTIEDADFTADEETRTKKVLDTIYDALVNAAKGDALKEGAVDENDIVSYCYYLVGEKDSKAVYYTSVNVSKPSELKLGYSDLKELSDIEAGVKAAVVALENVEGYIYSAEKASADGHTAYISYTVTPADGEDATTYSFVEVVLGNSDEAKAKNGEHQFVVDKMIESGAAVGTAMSDFKKTENVEVDAEEGTATTKDIATYSKATVNVIIDGTKLLVDGAEVALNAETKFKDSEGKEVTMKKDDKVNCYVYLVSYKQVEALTNESVVDSIIGANATKDALDCFADHEKLVDDFAKAKGELTAAETAEKSAKEAYDKAKDKLAEGADEATELKTEKEALDKATEELAAKKTAHETALKALLDAVVTEENANVIVDDYKTVIYEGLRDAYNITINNNLAEAIWHTMQECVTMDLSKSEPTKLVKEIYNRIYANHEHDFYTSEKTDDNESVYKKHKGNFKSYLAEVTNTQGKNHQEAKHVIWAEAREIVETMIVVYVVADAYDQLNTKADIKDYKKTVEYDSMEASYGESLTLTAYQFDTLMDYFLDVEKVTEKNDKGEDEEVPAKDELGRHKYLNIKYEIKADDAE